MSGSSNSRFRLTADPSSEKLRELLEGLLNAVETGVLSPRRAELLAGHVLMEWAGDHAEGPLVRVAPGVRRPVLPGTAGLRPRSTGYRLEADLRGLRLPVSIEAAR